MAHEQQTSGQRSIDFSDAARLAAHLARCGLSAVQAGLAGLVLARGELRTVGDERLRVLSISSRAAAKALGCNNRSVAQAAAMLSRREWFQVIKAERGKPPLYVLDPAAAASVVPDLERLEELWPASSVGGNGCAQPRAPVDRWVAVGAPGCASPYSSSNPIIKPVFSPHSYSDTAPPHGTHACAPVRTASEGTPAARPPAEQPPRAAALPPYPWSRAAGVTDADLVEACRQGDARLLGHLYEHAVRLGWIAASEDNWLRFLTGCHHAATARLARRMGRLVAFVKQGLDVSRCRQASEQWAAAVIARGRRDPELMRLGRLCGQGVDA